MVGIVGFCGSRGLGAEASDYVGGVASAAAASGRAVVVGCAAGADEYVRRAVPGAVVFRASAFGSGVRGLVARSAAMVRVVAGGGLGSGLVAFADVPCPSGVLPAASSAACFNGGGSGTWATVALAVGLGVPVIVVPGRHAVLPTWPGGQWQPVKGDGPLRKGFRFTPPPTPGEEEADKKGSAS